MTQLEAEVIKKTFMMVYTTSITTLLVSETLKRLVI